MNKLLSNDELQKLEEKADEARDKESPEVVKELYETLAKNGSGSACMTLATGYDIGGKLHPETLDSMFEKDRRRAKRYYNRALKCYRRQAKLGSYPAMYALHGLFYLGLPRIKKNRKLELVEYWLRKAAESGEEIPIKTLESFLEHKNG